MSANLFLFLRQAAYHHENAGVFPSKMCSDGRKNYGCGLKKPEGTSSAIFGVATAAKCCKLKRCADRVRRRTNHKGEALRQIGTFRLNFSTED